MAIETQDTAKKTTGPQRANKPKNFIWGLGRRKTAVARVRIANGQGNILINRRSVDEYFPEPEHRNAVRAPLEATQTKDRYDIWVNVQGGGQTGQAGAVLLGIARALLQVQPDLEQVLRAGGYLTRDARMVERKKYGQSGARKRYQFSKR